MAIKFIDVVGLAVTLMTAFAVMGCVPAYPEEPYFLTFENRQLDDQRGSISFTVNPNWERWGIRAGKPISQMTLLSSRAECFGALDASIHTISYKIQETAGKTQRIEFENGKAKCFSYGVQEVEIGIEPIQGLVPLFDSGETRYGEIFKISFKDKEILTP